MDIYYIIITTLSQLGSPTSLGIPDQDFGVGSFNSILNVVYMIAGVVAVVVGVIGGILLTTSSGDPNKAAKARNTIVYSAIGLVVTAAAFSITSFVTGKI